MNFTGSFRLLPLDYERNPAIQNLLKVSRAALRYAFYRALQEYVADIAKRIPVLTGATRTATLEVLEEIERRLGKIASDAGLPMSAIEIPVSPTKRQLPGSEMYPISPDSTPPYAKPYSVQHYNNITSRQEWRELASENTTASNLKSFTDTMVMNDGVIFNFTIETEDWGFNYWGEGEPSDYKPEEAAVDAYESTFQQDFQQYVRPLLIALSGEERLL